MPTTSLGFRYPASTSTVDVPADIGNLAADLNAYILAHYKPLYVIKPSDESVTSSAVLQADDHLTLAVAANTTYEVQAVVQYTEASATSSDIQIAWTMPASCRLDLGMSAAHENWVPGAGAALEAEWSGWQNQTASPTSAKKFGTSNVAVFCVVARGTLQVGASAGSFGMSWAQGTSNASATTVKSGSSLILRPLN